MKNKTFWNSLFSIPALVIFGLLGLSGAFFALMMIKGSHWFFYYEKVPIWYFFLISLLSGCIFFGLKYLIEKNLKK
jgi:hypothetical protein